MVISRIVPAGGAAVVFGCVFFGLQARWMNAREGRMDATAQPHGISTIIFFAYTLLIMTVGQLCSDGSTTRRQSRPLVLTRECYYTTTTIF